MNKLYVKIKGFANRVNIMFKTFYNITLDWIPLTEFMLMTFLSVFPEIQFKF